MKKYTKKPVSIVMIAYNEASHIKRVVEEYYQEIYLCLPKGSEFILYLDCPTDSTPKIVRKLAKKLDIRVVEGKKNLKYAGALKKALSIAGNDTVFYSDSSGKHIAGDFWELMKHENDYDIISGFRSKRKDSCARKFISSCQRIMISAFFLIPLHDFNSGYKIIHKNVLDDILRKTRIMRYTISVEILVRAIKKGYSVKSVPVAFFDRQDKKKGLNLKNLPLMAGDTIKGLFRLRTDMKDKQ
ncbi:MAG: glycosyltransferase family 2 protein [Nanoarchaeota archaeon]|nr:glycosyltransferase family 2 protein [Nanoarchaeota archaeon]